MCYIWEGNWWVCLPVARTCHCQFLTLFIPLYLNLSLRSIDCIFHQLMLDRFSDALTHILSITRLLIACLSHSMLGMRLSCFNSQKSIPWLQALVCMVFIAVGVGLLVLISRMHAPSSSSSASAAT